MWIGRCPRRDLPLPTWQRGHRVHGYWLDGQRLGHVGLSPRGLRPIVYTWAIDAAQGRSDVHDACGEARTLRTAKRRVEAAFRKLYSW
jgi:hypothetical protein